MHEHKELPSGKQIMKRFDDEGRVASESHTYGMLDIGITIDFHEGVKTGEMYFVKKRLVSRKRYDKARAEYADMPPPDSNLQDFGGELMKDVRAERRQRTKAAKEHVPDSDAAAQIDSFCQTMLTTGKHDDAAIWIESKPHTLGEHSHAKSRNIVSKLMKVGAIRVHACDIDTYDDDQENSGHLVVELPDDSKARESVFREIARLAALQGLDGDFDNGQRYAYVKLD